MMQRGGLATIVAVALSAGPVVGCSPSIEAPGSSGDAGAGGLGGSASSGGGGTGIPIDVDGAGDTAGCARLEGGAESVPWSGTPAQAHCDGSAPNPVECPAVNPEPGSPCELNEIECWYALGGGSMVSARCQGLRWTTVSRHCAEPCAPFAPEDAILGGPACGSLPEIPCDDRAMLTDQERLYWVLGEVARCCGYWQESGVTIWLEGGCTVAARVDGPGADQMLGECIRGLLAGRRFSCGTGLSCASVEWSTIN